MPAIAQQGGAAGAPTGTQPPPPVDGLSVLDELDDTPRLPDRAPGQTKTLDDLIREYRTQCGADGTRERLVTGLDRAIREEKDANRREIRKGQRERVAAAADGVCAPSATEPSTAVQTQPTPTTLTPTVVGPGVTFPRADDDLELDQIDATLARGDREEARRLIDGFKYKQLIKFGWLTPEQKARLESAENDAFSGGFADAVLRRAVLQGAEQERRNAKLKAFLKLYYLAPYLPRTGIGVRRDGAPGAAPEVDAGQTARRVNSLGISAGFQTKMSDNFDFGATIRYSKGDAATDYSVPASSAAQRIDTGSVFGRLSNGSSGFIAGFGGSGSTKVRTENYGISAEVGMSAAEIYAEASGFRVMIGVDYERAEREHDLSLQSSGTSGSSSFFFEQDRQQSLDEDYLGFYGGLEVEIPFSGETDGGLSFTGSLKIGPYHRDSQFDGSEHDTANFGPTSNRDFILDFAEDDSGWGGMIKADAEFEYRLDSGISLFVGGGIDYRSEVGVVVNPNSGDQVFFEGQTTRLEQDDASGWNAFFGLRFRY